MKTRRPIHLALHIGNPIHAIEAVESFESIPASDEAVPMHVARSWEEVRIHAPFDGRCVDFHATESAQTIGIVGKQARKSRTASRFQTFAGGKPAHGSARCRAWRLNAAAEECWAMDNFGSNIKVTRNPSVDEMHTVRRATYGRARLIHLE